jgi:hypothetical protein
MSPFLHYAYIVHVREGKYIWSCSTDVSDVEEKEIRQDRYSLQYAYCYPLQRLGLAFEPKLYRELREEEVKPPDKC